MVDTGYLDAELLATSQRDDGVELWGPTRQDVRWQAHVEGGFDVSRFVIDWGPTVRDLSRRPYQDELDSRYR